MLTERDHALDAAAAELAEVHAQLRSATQAAAEQLQSVRTLEATNACLLAGTEGWETVLDLESFGFEEVTSLPRPPHDPITCPGE